MGSPSKNTELLKQVRQAPKEPGIYKMLAKDGAIIYVGKAKNLRSRLLSYFRLKHDDRPLTQLLVRNVDCVQYIVTKNNDEALLLENTLIKQEKPKYNVRLKDDKDYVSLRLTIKHAFPRLTVVRRPKKKEKDGALYFGPFISGWAVKKIERFLYQLFPLRSCSDAVLKSRKRPCMLYQINLCSAPCVDYISKHDYRKLVKQVELFLKGDNRELVQDIEKQMQEASDAMDYEMAAELRDRLIAIDRAKVSQHVIFHDHRNVDAVGWKVIGSELSLVILTVRDGKVLNTREIHYQPIDHDHLYDVIETILLQYYLNDSVFVPPNILLLESLTMQASVTTALRERTRRKVLVRVPKRGAAKRLIELAEKNANMYLTDLISRRHTREYVLKQLQKALSMAEVPQRIETYDISNLQGQDAVGSQVTFIEGNPCKANYRHYKIRSVKGANDFAMLQEVLQRRFKELERNNHPQLILIDGGKGQLSAAAEVLKKKNIDHITLASIAKVPIDGFSKDILTDRIFVPGRKNHLMLKADHPGLRLLQQTRDEAHRFAVTYHHKVKKKRTLKTELTNVPGIGGKKAKDLLRKYGSVAKIRRLSQEELKNCPILGSKLGAALYQYLSDNHS